MTHLQELYDAVKAGVNPLRPGLLRAAIADGSHRAKAIGALYHDNTQAAIDFMQAVLPGWYWSVSKSRTGYGATVWDEHGRPMTIHSDTADTPARALLLAALAAMIAKETT